jgi:hypothetical protein
MIREQNATAISTTGSGRIARVTAGRSAEICED